MTPERWAQIKEVFVAVADQPASARDVTLDRLCLDDDDLRLQVEQLLSQHGKAGQFMEATPPLPAARATSERLEPGSHLSGRYQITKFLGSGGMGEVYAADDLELGEQVALKVIRQEGRVGPAMLDRLRREVQLARRVTHPNVCRVYDLGRHTQPGHDLIFLTMELIAGETLAERLRREGKISSTDALAVAVQLCHALDAAHHAGVLHRDFKCGNVMLIGSGEQVRAVVTDFGIARWIQPQTDTQSNASQTMPAGTPAYMSPEQLAGQPLTAASDIYALGLVLYEMVTGARPFRADSPLAEAFKRLNEPPEPPIKATPELSENWNYTILKCLEREPGKRFASAQEVIESLRGTAAASAPSARWPGKTSIHRTATHNRSIRRNWIAAALLFVLAALGFAVRDRIWSPRLPAQKHVAVLPFTFAGNDPSDGATTYGLAQSLSANLARLQPTESSLWVAPWSQTRSRKADGVGNAAAALGVNLLVTGSVEKNGERFRVHADLKDALTFKSLRSQIVDVPQAERVTLEDTLLERVAGMLQVKLPAGMLHHLPVDETVVPGAYEFYEQGRGYLLHFDGDNVERAIGLFQKAVEQDPNFALAYANLAYAYAWKFHRTQDTKWRDLAKQNAGKAKALNDDLASTHLALAMVGRDTGDIDAAVNEFQRALRLDPADDETLNLLALTYDDAGQTLQAESLLKDAVKRNPANWVNYNFLGSFYYRHAQYAQAELLLRAATQLAPDNPSPLNNLSGVLLAEGKYKDAEEILGRAITVKPTKAGYSNLGYAQFYQARYKDAAQMFQKAAELSPADDRLSRNLGDAYALAGEPAKAADAYARAVQQVQKLLALRPRDPQLLQNLALYYAKLGRKQNAQGILAQAVRFSTRDPEFIFNTGVIYELTGQRDRALRELHEALRSGYSLSELQNAPELSQLRADKRYPQIVSGPPD
ncbi:MAG TPA: protein kinase [Candidatus Angelobacter sp.]|nr:protein kinase [Candidatus Angelobacter sp.]